MNTVETNAATGEVTVREWTQEEIDARILRLTPPQWTSLRAERDRLLASSDIAMLPDLWMGTTEEQKAAWIAYRQALRDLPQNTTDPFNPVWPVAPT